MSDTLASEVSNQHIKAWSTYWGLLYVIEDEIDGLPTKTHVFGYENVSPANHLARTFNVPAGGAVFGFVSQGRASVTSSHNGMTRVVHEGCYFAVPDGCWGQIEPGSRLVAIRRDGFLGMSVVGGPIEDAGRLRYIDRCTDTLLVAPPLKGDPCLNHLHFPRSIDQTEHTHPSVRAGLVARGEGWCETPAGRSRLDVGLVWVIPTLGRHNFLTDDQHTMDVIAYHPDSDWGPTHEDHPMLNRTWVAGRPMDNTTASHQAVEMVHGDRRSWPVPGR